MYYFAYGSCMNESDFQRTIQTYRRLGKAVLRDYRLAFTHWSMSRAGGVADVVDSTDDFVEGILYEIDEAGGAALDIREGAGDTYDRKLVHLEFEGERIDNVLTYCVIHANLQEFAPSPYYASLILDGGSGVLSESFLQTVRNHIADLMSRDSDEC